MPKTKDAFGMRSTYEVLILYEYSDDEDKNKQNYDLLFNNILNENFDDTKEETNALIVALKTNEHTRKSIQRHTMRLQRYVDAITDKLVDDEKQPEKYLSKLRRAKILLTRYSRLEQTFWNLRLSSMEKYKSVIARLETLYKSENGLRLRKARYKKNLSQEQVAAMLGMTAVGYGAYERGERDIPTFTIYRLAKILDISATELLGI